MNKENKCTVITDGVYNDIPLITVVNPCSACTERDDCDDYRWAKSRLNQPQPIEEPKFIRELRESGYKFGKADHGWKPKDRNLI